MKVFSTKVPRTPFLNVFIKREQRKLAYFAERRADERANGEPSLLELFWARRRKTKSKRWMKSNVMITNWLINCLFVLAEYLSEDEFLYIDVCCRIIGVPASQNMGYHSSNKTRGLTLRITLRMTQQVQSKKEANLSKQVAEPQGRIQSLEQLLRQGKDVLTLEEAAKFMGFARKYCHFAMGGVIFPRI